MSGQVVRRRLVALLLVVPAAAIGSIAAAFWSGGSLAPANVPAVPPGETLTAQAAAGAAMSAAALTEPAKAAEKHRKFLALGIDVANGKNQWT